MNKIIAEFIKPEQVTIKNGAKAGQKTTKYSIKATDGNWYTSWREVKLHEPTRGIISEREYNGKTYYDFEPIKPELAELYDILEDHEKRLRKLEPKKADSFNLDDIPLKPEDEINLDDIEWG